MSQTISIKQADVFTALRTWLLTVVPQPACEVVRGQDNLVSMPAGDFVAMTQKGMRRISTPVSSWVPGTANPGVRDVTAPTEITVQLDFYGAGAADNAAMVQALFRDEYGDEGFPDAGSIKPLYAEDPVQMPLVDGEENYTQRWMVQAVLQYNPVIAPAQDFAGSLAVTTVSVERTYPA